MEKQLEIRDRRIKEKFMVDDAYLNGYARICGIYATGVYLSLCRHADADQKCWPSQGKIAEELNISRDKVNRSIKILESHKIIIKDRVGKKANNRYWLTDKSEWSSDVANNDITCRPQRHHPVVINDIHSKETHSKETHSKVATQSVAEVFEVFESINPTIMGSIGNKTQRAAASELLKRMTIEQIGAAVAFVRENSSDRFCPQITTPYALMTKLGDLVAYRKKQRSGSKLIKI